MGGLPGPARRVRPPIPGPPDSAPSDSPAGPSALDPARSARPGPRGPDGHRRAGSRVARLTYLLMGCPAVGRFPRGLPRATTIKPAASISASAYSVPMSRTPLK
jgi:hypothetical protein